MQCETLYNLHRKVYFLFSKKAKFCAINFRNLKNWSHTILAYFENKKYTIEISFMMQIVELFMLHLVVYFVF